MNRLKRITAQDMRARLIRQALFWRSRRRQCDTAMKDYYDGRYAEAIDNLWWLRGRAL